MGFFSHRTPSSWDGLYDNASELLHANLTPEELKALSKAVTLLERHGIMVYARLRP